MSFGKKICRSIKHVAHAPAKIVHEVGHATKNVIHETGKIVNNVAHAPKKVIHSMVKSKVNAAFEKKMLEAIDNVEKELGERKSQDKAVLDQAITNAIHQVAEIYKNLTEAKALQAAEIELMEMLRSLTAAIHDCRFGFKDSVEDILKLEFDDYRVMEFLNRRPLMLTLLNFASHQNTEALSILLPYFNNNFQKLSAENKADFIVLKDHVLKVLGEQNNSTPYFSNLTNSEDILKNPNCRESITGNNWTPLHAAMHHVDVELVKALLDRGAFVVRDNNKRLPHEVPLLSTLAQNSDYLQKYQAGIQLIKNTTPGTGIGGVGAMYSWQDDILKNPNCRELMTGHYWTPLHAAVHHGDAKWVRYLLDRGAFVVRDRSKRLAHEVPLWPALAKNPDCLRGYQECVQLIKNISPGMGIGGVGAMYPWQDDILKNPNCRELMTGYYWTPLHAAVHHADVEMVESLLRRGAVLEKDALNRYPCSAPLWPALAENPDCLRRYQEAVQLTNPQAVKNMNRSINKDANLPALDVNNSNIFNMYTNKIAEDAKAGTLKVINNIITTGVKATVSQNITSSTANVLSQLTAGKTGLLANNNKDKDYSNDKMITIEAATTNATLPTQTVNVASKNTSEIQAPPSIVCRP